MHMKYKRTHKRERRQQAMATEVPDTLAAMRQQIEELHRQLEVQAQIVNPKASKPLNHRYRLPVDQFQGGGWAPNVANNFELNPGLISMVQGDQFGGGVTEDPIDHLRTFLDICDMIKQNGVSPDTIKMRMFRFSLRDRAMDWFKSLDRTKISTWEQLCDKFLAKYFPPARAHKIIAEISQFSQARDELMCEAWERFRGLLRRCPQHGFSQEQQIIFFYSGLTHNTKRIVDVTAGGSFLNTYVEEATRIIEDMASNSYQWPTERQPSRRVVAAAESDSQYDDLYEKFTLLKREYDNDRKGMGIAQAHVVQQSESSDVHNTDDANQGGNPDYYPNNRDHPNFFYANPNNAM